MSDARPFVVFCPPECADLEGVVRQAIHTLVDRGALVTDPTGRRQLRVPCAAGTITLLEGARVSRPSAEALATWDTGPSIQ